MSVGLAATALAVAALAAPVGSPGTRQSQDTARLTAWTVTKHPGGVVDVTIRELKDPAGLQKRMRADGVPTILSTTSTAPACHPYYPDYQYIPPLWLLKGAGNYPWTHSYDNGSVAVSVTSPAYLTLAFRPARLPRGTAFQIIPEPAASGPAGFITALGLVKTSPACTA